MGEQLLLCLYKDMAGRDGNLEVCLHGQWTSFKLLSDAFEFSGSTSSMSEKRQKKKKKKLPCLHVQIQTACSISALSCLFPPLCKTGISKDKLVPRQSVATNGRCSDLSAQNAHPTKGKVSGWLPFTTTITRTHASFTRALLIAPCKSCTH